MGKKKNNCNTEEPEKKKPRDGESIMKNLRAGPGR